MDATVPAGAAILLDFVRKTEVGTESRNGYDVIYGFNQDKLAQPVTIMTVDEVLSQQAGWSKRFGSSATGGYQFMRATLGDLKRELGLSGSQVMDPDLQDRLGYHLLKRRGYEQFVAGLINRTEFGKRLAQEWASFPVLAGVQGAHRSLSRGQSYYAGDRLNKALITPEQLEAVIDEALIAARSPQPIRLPEPQERPEFVFDIPSLIRETVETIMPQGERELPIRIPGPSPISQVSKAVGAGKWSVLGGAIWSGLVITGVVPEPYNSPEFSVVVSTIVGSLAAIIGAYRAPRNAE